MRLSTITANGCICQFIAANADISFPVEPPKLMFMKNESRATTEIWKYDNTKTQLGGFAPFKRVDEFDLLPSAGAVNGFLSKQRGRFGCNETWELWKLGYKKVTAISFFSKVRLAHTHRQWKSFCLFHNHIIISQAFCLVVAVAIFIFLDVKYYPVSASPMGLHSSPDFIEKLFDIQISLVYIRTYWLVGYINTYSAVFGWLNILFGSN